ncbi:succinate dehydrogenase assembly factor 2 mitochondrial [Biomphalaria glabrata]
MSTQKLLQSCRILRGHIFPLQGALTKEPIHMQRRCLSDPSDSSKFYTPEDLSPPIPPYQQRYGETLELKRARLLYQSRKRGMLENGLLLSTFAKQHLNTLTEDQLSSYDKLINQPSNDWDIYYWVTGVKEIPEEYRSDVMDLLKNHAKNSTKESRIKQPDL